MAYRLVVGTSPWGNLVGDIDYNEFPVICELAENTKSNFLNRLTDLYTDERFDMRDLEQARDQLFELMLKDLAPAHRAFVYKMAAVVSYALYKEQPLFGVAD